MSMDFPVHIPVGKDADILCEKKDAMLIKAELIEWCRKFDMFDVIAVDSSTGYRIRMQMDGTLYYLLDVSWADDDIGNSFVSEVLQNRICKDNYYVLEDRFEIIIRANAYRKKSSKKYHRDWVLKHCNMRHEALIRHYCTFSLKEIMAK